jgi:hypothetical protein
MQTWSESLDRGTAIRESALEEAGGALSAREVAELLGITGETVEQRRRRGELLAVPISSGEWGYPARQLTPDGRVRDGLKDVLAAFSADEDPWVILAFLTNPDPLSGEAIAFDALDDPEATRAMIPIARTFWEQGAA